MVFLHRSVLLYREWYHPVLGGIPRSGCWYHPHVFPDLTIETHITSLEPDRLTRLRGEVPCVLRSFSSSPTPWGNIESLTFPFYCV